MRAFWVSGKRQRAWPCLFLIRGFLILAGVSACGQAAELWELPPLRYSQTKPNDPLARLVADVQAGKKSLPVKDTKSLLLALLRELDIPVESQVLVFSKTSKQVSLISPGNPRAIYFSDNAYLAWVPGGSIEAIVHDPVLGPVFYEVMPSAEDGHISLQRSGSCLACHIHQGGSLGLTLRSTKTARSGTPGAVVDHAVNHRTPYQKRWGGWYVTGRLDGMKHLGNWAGGQALDLDRQVPAGRYPHAGSDVLALMLLDHQARMYSLLVRAKMHYQRALWLEKALAHQGGSAPGGETSASARLADRMAEEILSCLLFANEAELPGDGVQASASFQRAFQGQGRLPAGNQEAVASPTFSLRDLRLYKRIFKYRCSYMIYSDGFRDLPAELKSRVMSRLYQVLEGKDTSGAYDYLGARERSRILQILNQTLVDEDEAADEAVDK
ncbi:hypothetical protein HW115_14320 [Verrucomicrobiaceae bacterium N1E253]|uniref:Cytochrome c domain-containing protein n=1 Tax=Oceaniferula marina TaxID=2748318 RepID=A0A851GRF8_9BACT|nr:hypothetical protein [Oceaniferula marina]NWK56794.1 hypothetical protein [Oceaniferula marina]